MSSLTNYAENKIIDALFRAQPLGAPATWYVGVMSDVADAEAGTLTEITGGGYARVAVTASLAAWAGTQAAGSTTASSGTNGTTSNNAAITFPPPTGNWSAQATHLALFDASSGGNAWAIGTLAAPKTVNNGDPAPSFSAAALTFALN